MKLTDEELISRFRQSGDNEWIGYLLQRYTVLLLGVAMKYLKDRSCAEDAVQQVFYKALTHFPESEIQNFKGWLYVLMRNYCLQQLRERKYNVAGDGIQHLAAAEEQYEMLQQKEYTLEQMNEALNELNEDQRRTVVLFYLHKMSYQQIMDRTGYSYMQVKSFIQNGKRNLKMLLVKKLGRSER